VPELLLEIGFEEMPASWLPALREQLRLGFVNQAYEHRLTFHEPPQPGVSMSLPPREPVWEDSRVFSTPRRLVLVTPLPESQRPSTLDKWGPALSASRDKDGRWTKAALGFATKVGVEPEQLKTGIRSGTERRLLFQQELPQFDAVKVLPAVIAGAMRSLSFPKRMNWDAWLEDGKGAFPFGRPIRWLLALLDGNVVPFTIYAHAAGAAGPPIVVAGSVTYGHRFLPRGSGGRPLTVSSFDDLKSQLSSNFVMLDHQERAKRIRDSAELNHDLLVEWPDLVEYPTLVAGRVPAEFGHLPREVLETVLVHHQKYIPLTDQGRVTRFQALTNTDGSAADAIVQGMERVVVARLRDAAFFFAEDRKRPLQDRVENLDGVTFHQGLGTYKEKTLRLRSLIEAMGESLGLLTNAERDHASAAAWWAKADLTTLMVREFPELQGVMGAIYLEAQGENRRDILDAIRWHYYPVSVETDSVPTPGMLGHNRVFAALSLADKVDTVVGHFALGANPTGSRDPFGLRRAAQGAIRVALDFWTVTDAMKRPNLLALVSEALLGYRHLQTVDVVKVGSVIKLFLLDRLQYLLGIRGYPADEVAAAMYTSEVEALSDPYDCLVRLEVLHRVRTGATEDFEHLAAAFKRANNILEQAKQLGVSVLGFQPNDEFPEGAERELDEALRATRDPASLMSGPAHYEWLLTSLARIRPKVDQFFEDVMVLDEDQRVRQRRLELLHRTVAPVLQVADLSKLGG
jgi:glycyl-tRNA synthetase beta chain